MLKVTTLSEKLSSTMQMSLNEQKERFIKTNSKLIALNPMAVLNRGYGAVFDGSNKVIKSIDNVDINDEISVKIVDGVIKATVVGKEGKIDG